jgi:hypothetical protein
VLVGRADAPHAVRGRSRQRPRQIEADQRLGLVRRKAMGGQTGPEIGGPVMAVDLPLDRAGLPVGAGAFGGNLRIRTAAAQARPQDAAVLRAVARPDGARQVPLALDAHPRILRRRLAAHLPVEEGENLGSVHASSGQS